jgi:hypothetical protein
VRSDKKLVLRWRQRLQVLGCDCAGCKTECPIVFLQINQSGRRKPATIGENKMKKPTVGQKIEMPVYGKIRVVTVLAVHSFGTIDVETEMGNVLRITGLSFI